MRGHKSKIRRLDTLNRLALIAAVCVHWFNPLVQVMYVLANRDIELSCNETVVKSFGETVKSTYALILIGKLIMAAEPMCNTENIIDIFLTEAFYLQRPYSNRPLSAGKPLFVIIQKIIL